MNHVKQTAEKLARAAGMQYDRPSCHWIAARGKFEGEEWYAPYFWHMVLEGDGESIDNGEEHDLIVATLFQVDGEESEAFALECGHWVLVREDGAGFVFVSVYPSREDAEEFFNKWIGG